MEILQVISKQEQSQLDQSEERIDSGFKSVENTFRAIGKELMFIRDNKLYRGTHSTFEKYCNERWDKSRRYVNMTIAGESVMQNLEMGTIVPKTLPTTESQTRPIANYEPEIQREAWNEVVETNKPEEITAKKVQEVASNWAEADNFLKERKQEQSTPSVFVQPTPMSESEILAKAKEIRQSTGNFHVSNKENEWYTPKETIDLVRAVLGVIDLDPASSEFANKIVKANKIYTKEDDGISKDWKGNVWLNPPYSMPEIADFCDKVAFEYNNGNIKQACVITNNSTDTRWFHLLLDNCQSICILQGREKFYCQDENVTLAARQGQVIFYFGNNKESFKNAFSQRGKILMP